MSLAKELEMLNTPLSQRGENVAFYKLQSNCCIYPPPPLLFSVGGCWGSQPDAPAAFTPQ